MQTKSTEVRKKRVSDDKKIELAKQFIDKKKSINNIASECNVSEQTVRNWVKKYQNIDQIDITEPIENLVDYVYANIVPTPLVYTLEEAATVAKISSSHLLHYAALGKIVLFINRPIDILAMPKNDLKREPFLSSENLQQYRLDEEILDAHQNLLKKMLFCYKFDFLMVSQADCHRLESGLHIRKSNFHAVSWVDKTNQLMISGNHEFYTVTESVVKDKNGECTEKDCHSIQISKQMLNVSSKELEELIDSEIKRKAHREPSQEPFAVHKNKSSFLVALDQAAFELWGDFNPIRTAIFNTSEKVAEYLQDNFKFCKANAQPLALLITPSAENRILPSIDSKEMSYRPRLLSVVIQAWEVVCMPRKFEKGANPVKYEDDAKKWLMDKCPDLTKYEKTISNVVRLLTPDNAPFEKLRKTKK